MFKRLRYHIAVFFSVIGPGFITAVVDNDAGGIFTYSQAGAKYGYLPLWTLLPITLLLIVTQEMCSRMGAVTGKGLSDLIREEFGLRTTFFVMMALIGANLTNVMANFAGIASSLELFGISRYISVPIGALIVWLLVVKGSYASVERIFLFATALYVCYIVSGVLVKPDWKEAAIYSVKPVLFFDTDYIKLLIGMVGTSVAPWMQFYLQAAIVEKGISAKEYVESRIEVIVGCVVMTIIAFFIIVACAGQARMITAAHVKPGAAVIDVGVSRTEAGIVGDVDFDAVQAVAGAITPMPRGTGPMTIADLGKAPTVTATWKSARTQVHGIPAEPEHATVALEEPSIGGSSGSPLLFKASWLTTFRRIILPLLKPGLIAGWIYVVIVSVRELSSSILLYSPGSEVVPVMIWELWQNGQYVELSALGVMLIAMLFCFVMLAQFAGKKFGVAEA